jgi:hypothetical protein
MRMQWVPTVYAETNKLGNKDHDWKLPGTSLTMTRTRHGGKPVRKQSPEDGGSSGESSFVAESSSSSDEDDLACFVEEAALKPPPSRFIVEEELLTQTFQETSRCQSCNGKLQVEYKTVCLATTVILKCQDPGCTYIHHSRAPAKTTVHTIEEDGNYERSTDYAVNVLHVLGFLASGDGGTEAARLLGLLGLPNDTTMESRSFSIIEERIGPFIRSLGDEILFENLCAEVKTVLTDENDYEQWCRSVTDPMAPPLSSDRYPTVDASYDCAWQQKKSGHSYDSPSGHGLMFGNKTRRPNLWDQKQIVFLLPSLQEKASGQWSGSPA